MMFLKPLQAERWRCHSSRCLSSGRPRQGQAGACRCSFSRQQHGRSETEEYSSESESESEDEEELQVILEDLQRQNEELEVRCEAQY